MATGTKELHGTSPKTGKFGRPGSISPLEFSEETRIPYLRKGQTGAASGIKGDQDKGGKEGS